MIKYIPISIAELIDKITILEIKQNNITNEQQLKNVTQELYLLLQLDTENILSTDLYTNLKNINELLWEVEERLRKYEKRKKFDEDFIEDARSVYKLNDQRSEIKKQINIKYKSSLLEEKSYE